MFDEHTRFSDSAMKRQTHRKPLNILSNLGQVIYHQLRASFAIIVLLIERTYRKHELLHNHAIYCSDVPEMQKVISLRLINLRPRFISSRLLNQILPCCCSAKLNRKIYPREMNSLVWLKDKPIIRSFLINHEKLHETAISLNAAASDYGSESASGKRDNIF